MLDQYFATVARGLESIAAQELEKLGAQAVQPDFTGVHFQGDKALLYRVNLWARTIFRVLKPIQTIKAIDANQIYDAVQTINWKKYLQPEQTLAINCTGGNKQLNHNHYTAIGIKKAIVDQQMKKLGKRSNVDSQNPDILINAHIYQNDCILSLDSSGESLHRRGYRPAMGLAPLKETLAAALLEIAEWDSSLPFFDPLCGSGTLPIEASLKALKIAPGLYRQKFAFQNWADFDESLWLSLVKEAKNNQLSQLPATINGSDSEQELVKQAISNARLCGVAQQVKFSDNDLSNITPPAEVGVIMCNPPYGKRLGNVQELKTLYKLLGDVLKQRFTGWTAYILTGNKELSKQIGLRSSRRFPVYNGSLPCTLIKYELY